jgi:hypothetical protein
LKIKKDKNLPKMSKLASLRELEASLTSQLEGVRTEIKSLESVESSVSDPVASPAQAPEEEGKCGTPENGEEDWEGERR